MKLSKIMEKYLDIIVVGEGRRSNKGMKYPHLPAAVSRICDKSAGVGIPPTPVELPPLGIQPAKLLLAGSVPYRCVGPTSKA